MSRAGPLIVSVVILALYAAHSIGWSVRPVSWSEGDGKLMDTCLTLVVGYWLGSSRGSVVKSEQMAGNSK